MSDTPFCPATESHGRTENSAAGTPEQKFCGTWYRCAKCGSSILLESPELSAQLSTAKPRDLFELTP